MTLSPLQTSMVLASLRAPRSGVYIVQDVCRFEEELDVPRLKQAWDMVAARHAALRSAIDPAGLTLRLDPNARYEWRELGDDQELETFLREDWGRGFNFDEGVPIRFALLRGAPEGRWTLVWTVHHALLDGRSLLIVWREWLAVYDGQAQDAAPIASIERSEPAGAETFWRSYLAGLSETTGCILDRLNSHPAGGFSQQGVRLSLEQTAALRALASRHDVTLSTLVLAAWALLLSRYSDRTEVVFGVTSSRRHCRFIDQHASLPCRGRSRALAF
jgi:hypothetical protein